MASDACSIGAVENPGPFGARPFEGPVAPYNYLISVPAGVQHLYGRDSHDPRD